MVLGDPVNINIESEPRCPSCKKPMRIVYRSGVFGREIASYVCNDSSCYYS